MLRTGARRRPRLAGRHRPRVRGHPRCGRRGVARAELEGAAQRGRVALAVLLEAHRERAHVTIDVERRLLDGEGAVDLRAGPRPAHDLELRARAVARVALRAAERPRRQRATLGWREVPGPRVAIRALDVEADVVAAAERGDRVGRPVAPVAPVADGVTTVAVHGQRGGPAVRPRL